MRQEVALKDIDLSSELMCQSRGALRIQFDCIYVCILQLQQMHSRVGAQKAACSDIEDIRLAWQTQRSNHAGYWNWAEAQTRQQLPHLVDNDRL